MKKNSMTLFIVFIYLTTFISSAETLTVMLYEGANPPYSIVKDGKQQGIFVDLFAKISAITPYTFIFKSAPPARALREFDLGRIDIEPGVNEVWRQNAKVLGKYTIPYGHSNEIIVFKEKNSIKITKAKDLYGKAVGIVRGYSYPKFDQAFENKLITKVSNRSEKLLLKQLMADRIKYLFIGDITIKYYMQQNPQYRDLVIGDMVSSVAVKLRVHPSKAYIIETLNTALRALIAQGEIDKIYQKYQ